MIPPRDNLIPIISSGRVVGGGALEREREGRGGWGSFLHDDDGTYGT